MAFSYAEQQRQIKKFLDAEIKDMEKATDIVTQATAQKLAQETKKDLRRNFKLTRGSNFAKAVKVYNLPQKGVKGPASFVRLGIPWIGVFEEGETIAGEPWLTILLPEGQRLGFKRKMKSPEFLEAKQQKRIFTRSVRDGFIVYLRNPNGKPSPIYKVQKSPVKLPKRLNFYATAESLGDDMSEAIANLIN